MGQLAPAPADASASDTSAGKALALLRAFRECSGSASLTELAICAGQPKSTAHRLLAILCDAGFVDRRDNVYYLRWSMLELGALAMGGEAYALRETALPYLTDLFQCTQQTVHLAVLDGPDVVYLEKLHRDGSVIVPTRVGSRLPAHACALGKVLLAYASPAEIAAVARRPLRKIAPRTVAVAGSLTAELVRIRRDGLAHEFEEACVGVACVAAPVLDASGRAVAAVSVCARTTDYRQRSFEIAVQRTSRAIGVAWRARYRKDLRVGLV